MTMTRDSNRLPPPSTDFARDERGAIMVVAVFMSAFLVGGLWYIMGVGDAIIYRQTVQAGADATAFTGAVYHARGMNIIAMVNITIGAVMAIGAAAAMLMQMATAIIAVATNMCELSRLPPQEFTNADGELETIDYSPLAYACETIDPAKELMEKLRAVVTFIAQDRDSMLVGLSTSQVEVARTAPWVGSAQGSTVAAGHAPYVTGGGSGSPSMVPTAVRQGLPTMDEPFEKACQRSTQVLTKLVDLIVPAVLDPILAKMDLNFAKQMPSRICAGNNTGNRGWDFFDKKDVCKEKYRDDDNRHKRKKCEDDLEENEKPVEDVDLVGTIDPSDKSTKGMFTAAQNGNDYMQVYGAVSGNAPWITRSDKGVELASWGSSTAAAPGSMDEDKGVAAAEFFYDQTRASAVSDTCWPQWTNCPAGLDWASFKENTLWNLRWRARMRRFRAPTAVDVNVLSTQISDLGDVGYDQGLGAYNSSTATNAGLLTSTDVASTVGGNASSFIGPGSNIIH
jgi:hypothetical protein